MKSKYIILIFVLIIIAVTSIILINNSLNRRKSETEQFSYQVPRVLIITSGKDGNGRLPEGVVLMMEYFIKNGAFVQIENRDVLLDEQYLSDYNILILLSAIEYHDADRRYSLTYMEDVEIKILCEWVHNGGFLISGDNIGRNLRNGADRISMYGRLDPDNWGLSECFGVMMSERNIQGCSLKGKISGELQGELLPVFETETWVLVPDSVLSADAEILAYWESDSLKFPGLIFNNYGKGGSFLLPSSYLLHPSNCGGYWSPAQIFAFCNVVVDKYFMKYPFRVELQMWPDGYNAAFAVSLNSDGNIDTYVRMEEFLEENKIQPTLFVNGSADKEIIEFINKKAINIQSNGLQKTNMRNLSFSETVFQIEMNRRFWAKKFTGFRFPFTMNNVWGMQYLDRKKYLYDSSIGIDHSDTYNGCLFPYNLPVYQGENYQVLDLLEISPMSRDDYYYFSSVEDEKSVNPLELFEKSLLFDAYLQNFWKEIVLKTGGLMIYLGHPQYTAYNDTTLLPLSNLIATARNDHAWITTIEEISLRWHRLKNLKLKAQGNSHGYSVEVILPQGELIENLTLRVYNKPKDVKVLKGKVHIQENSGTWLIIFDAMPGQKLEVEF